MKTIQANNKTYKFGRNRSVGLSPRFKLKDYLGAGLPVAPTAINYASSAQPELKEMYLNDALGDCVIAMMAHCGGVFLGNAGGKLFLSSDQITALYSAIGGYVPGDESTDNGCDIKTALRFWRQNGLIWANPNPHRIKGWIGINPSSVEEIQTAIWLFENVVFGVELPDAWVNPMPSGEGFVWDVAGDPDQDNGHCFPGIGYGSAGYNHKGVEICPWGGMLGTLTYSAIAKYAAPSSNGELYSVLSPEIIMRAKEKAPNGFDWAQLQADFAILG